jgi:hypothetical protein
VALLRPDKAQVVFAGVGGVARRCDARSRRSRGSSRSNRENDGSEKLAVVV